MGVKLPGRSLSGGTTDHSEELDLMRLEMDRIVARNPVGAGPALGDDYKDMIILMAAIALLEVHDASGISLDNWLGPKELVEEAMIIIGRNELDLIANGV